ncbi:hypothetical protein ILYODFUR_028128 [Ilyodon furcidens]|uniref:Uncharacterized protein n=1 Tax=Ilyodon furcidens TaxID=33524 RepID=A0ABV0TYB4_9TELE
MYSLFHMHGVCCILKSFTTPSSSVQWRYNVTEQLPCTSKVRWKTGVRHLLVRIEITPPIILTQTDPLTHSEAKMSVRNIHPLIIGMNIINFGHLFTTLYRSHEQASDTVLAGCLSSCAWLLSMVNTFIYRFDVRTNYRKLMLA